MILIQLMYTYWMGISFMESIPSKELTDGFPLALMPFPIYIEKPI